MNTLGTKVDEIRGSFEGKKISIAIEQKNNSCARGQGDLVHFLQAKYLPLT